MRSRPAALAALTLSSALIVLLSLVGGRFAALGFAVLAMAFPVLLMIVGAAGRDGGPGSTAWPILALFVTLEACLGGMLALAGQVEAGAWVLGLPAAASLQLYGLLLVPLVLVAVGYALTFDSFDVGADDLERLRGLADSRHND